MRLSFKSKCKVGYYGECGYIVDMFREEYDLPDLQCCLDTIMTLLKTTIAEDTYNNTYDSFDITIDDERVCVVDYGNLSNIPKGFLAGCRYIGYGSKWFEKVVNQHHRKNIQPVIISGSFMGYAIAEKKANMCYIDIRHSLTDLIFTLDDKAKCIDEWRLRVNETPLLVAQYGDNYDLVPSHDMCDYDLIIYNDDLYINCTNNFKLKPLYKDHIDTFKENLTTTIIHNVIGGGGYGSDDDITQKHVKPAIPSPAEVLALNNFIKRR